MPQKIIKIDISNKFYNFLLLYLKHFIRLKKI
jgi:hypothetical protein